MGKDLKMIPDSLLTEWSYSGKSEYDSNVYSRLRDVILSNFPTEDIFLQGSYANSTGVYESSDVDIVVICAGYFLNSFNPYKDLKHLQCDLYDEIEGACNFHFE